MCGNKKHPELSLIVPLYNEASCLEHNVSQMLFFLEASATSYEIVLVNDGSTDNTGAICNRLATDHPAVRAISSAVNRGKGWAVKTGMLKAQGVYEIFTDADLAVPVHFVSPLLKRLRNGAQIVIGSRHLPGSSFKVREGICRQFFGEIFRRLARFSLGLKVSDITCGFKGFSRAAAFEIFSRSLTDKWGYDAEVVFLAQKLHYPIQEIPVEWCHSFDSKVKVGIDSIRTFVELASIIRYYWMDRYNLQRHKGTKRLDERLEFSDKETGLFPTAPLAHENASELTGRSCQRVSGL